MKIITHGCWSSNVERCSADSEVWGDPLGDDRIAHLQMVMLTWGGGGGGAG